MVAHKFPAPVSETESSTGVVSAHGVLRDARMWGLFIANILCMGIYSLWGNWTTLFLTDHLHVPFAETPGLAALPPIFLTAGGLFGGFLAMRMVRDARSAFRSRMHICWGAAVLVLANAAVPFLASPAWAVAAICAACFFTVALSVNLYSMPLDFFEPRTVAFAVSLLTAAYGVLQFGILHSSAGFSKAHLAASKRSASRWRRSLAACVVPEATHRFGARRGKARTTMTIRPIRPEDLAALRRSRDFARNPRGRRRVT